MNSPTAGLTSALSDRYRLDRELGQGGMAPVYLAPDRQVMVKVLRPELAAVIGAERFLAEIKTSHLEHDRQAAVRVCRRSPAGFVPGAAPPARAGS